MYFYEARYLKSNIIQVTKSSFYDYWLALLFPQPMFLCIKIYTLLHYQMLLFLSPGALSPSVYVMDKAFLMSIYSTVYPGSSCRKALHTLSHSRSAVCFLNPAVNTGLLTSGLFCHGYFYSSRYGLAYLWYLQREGLYCIHWQPRCRK